MKLVATVAAAMIAGIGAPAFAQDPAAAPAQQPAVDAESVKKAEGVLQDSAKAYAAAKALTDVITFTAKTPDGDQTQSMQIALQGSDQVRIGVEEMTFTAVGGSLFAERKGVEDVYAQFEVGGDLSEALVSQIGFVPPQIIARSSTDVAKLVEAWTFGMLPMAQLAGHSMDKNADGAELHKLALSSPAGSGEIHVDSKSMLVNSVTIRMVMEGSPEMVITLGYQPKPSDAVSPAIAFEPGERRKVSSLDDLKIDLTGKPAPDFTLEALDGTKVTLSEMKGNVVVLDFWATWCGPCKMGLPKLSEFAQWAKDNNRAVKVFGVDVWERGEAANIRKSVESYWTSSKFVMPTLLDPTNTTPGLYAFDAIPTTVIVGPDGKVFKVHTGFDEGMVDLLKKDVEAALAAAGR